MHITLVSFLHKENRCTKYTLFFIKFCITSGADITEENERRMRPADTAFNVYTQLKNLVSPNNKELHAKEMILHALLACTPSYDERRDESFLTEVLVAKAVAENPESYDYDWDKYKKKFRKNLRTLAPAMAAKSQDGSQ